MIINCAEEQKKIGDTVRNIVSNERAIQSALICVDSISQTLSRYPMFNDEIKQNIERLSIKSSMDNNYWINYEVYSNQGRVGDETFNCRVKNFTDCSNGLCSYKAVVEGYNFFDNQEENNINLYIEWKLDEYRFYVKKLNIIGNFGNSL